MEAIDFRTEKEKGGVNDFNTSIVVMKENLTKIKAKELYYFKWESGGLYTVMAGDGKKYGQIITIGYTNNVAILDKIKLPKYNHCPIP